MEPFIGQIIMFGGNFAPRGWALCDGQLLPIAQNQALFSILGTTYGGDGRTNFKLPELRGRSPIHAGTGPGQPTYRLGASGGNFQIQLNVNHMPSHTHTVNNTLKVRAHSSNNADTDDPDGAVNGLTGNNLYSTQPPDSDMASLTGAVALANTGGNQAFNTMNPYQAVNYIIALVGTFPSRN